MFVNQLMQGGIRALVAWDPTLFEWLNLPDDLNDDEVRQLIVDRIIFKYGDAPLFCPDPAVMKYYIGEWSYRRSPLWARYYAAITAEYDPLENYNRHEDTTDDFTHGHKITTNDDLKHGLTVEDQISADNASTYQPANKGINSGTDERDFDETHSGKDSRTIKGHIHGNIGVTTSQQMLASELDLVPRLDIIDYIVDDWHQEFCLFLYNY